MFLAMVAVAELAGTMAIDTMRKAKKKGDKPGGGAKINPDEQQKALYAKAYYGNYALAWR